ncbi:DUF2812 domain-containing protein [Cohnella cholangitidis]|nr:DUF2812 domain-containing protein [Cohnella cholangitidis]
MARNKRYVSSGGLAFTEQGDMNKLSRLAAKGWLLDSFAPFGYKVRKSEPQQLIYSVDYNNVKPNEMEDYIELFEAGGWSRVCSSSNIHIFSAVPGTKPIYTDNETKVEKYKRTVRMLRPLLVIPLLTAILFVLSSLPASSTEETTALEQAFKTAGLIGLVPSLPILMTYAAYRVRLRRIK